MTNRGSGRSMRAGTGRDTWLRGIVPMLDLFMLLFAALLVLVTQEHQEEMQQKQQEMQEQQVRQELDLAAVSTGIGVVTIEVRDGEALEIGGVAVALGDLRGLLMKRAADGTRLVLLRDPARVLTHGTMKKIRAAATEADMRTVFTTD